VVLKLIRILSRVFKILHILIGVIPAVPMRASITPKPMDARLKTSGMTDKKTKPVNTF
jgi:hypothetical protein